MSGIASASTMAGLFAFNPAGSLIVPTRGADQSIAAAPLQPLGKGCAFPAGESLRCDQAPHGDPRFAGVSTYAKRDKDSVTLESFVQGPAGSTTVRQQSMFRDHYGQGDRVFTRWDINGPLALFQSVALRYSSNDYWLGRFERVARTGGASPESVLNLAAAYFLSLPIDVDSLKADWLPVPYRYRNPAYVKIHGRRMEGADKAIPKGSFDRYTVETYLEAYPDDTEEFKVELKPGGNIAIMGHFYPGRSSRFIGQLVRTAARMAFPKGFLQVKNCTTPPSGERKPSQEPPDRGQVSPRSRNPFSSRPDIFLIAASLED